MNWFFPRRGRRRRRQAIFTWVLYVRGSKSTFTLGSIFFCLLACLLASDWKRDDFCIFCMPLRGRELTKNAISSPQTLTNSLPDDVGSSCDLWQTCVWTRPLLNPRVRFPRFFWVCVFWFLYGSEIQRARRSPDNADLFSFLLSFLFLPARAVNIYTKPHILRHVHAVFHSYKPPTIRASFHPIADTWSPVECAPPEKKYITHFSVVLSCVCIF